MPRSPVVRRPSVPVTPRPWYPDDFLPRIRHALGALADLESRYEMDREHLRAWVGPEPVRNRLAGELEHRYRAERELHARRLAELQRQLTMVTACIDIGRPD